MHFEKLPARLLLAADPGWAFNRGASGFDHGNAVATDGGGNVIVAATVNRSFDIDPSSGTTGISSPSTDSVLIAKYTSGKTLAWGRVLGGSGEQNVQGVATDAAGNVYAAGYFSGTLDFDGGAGVTKITARGKHDAFVFKLNSSGSLQWVKTFGGAGDEGVTSLAADASGNTYAMGMFDTSGDYDPGSGTRTLTPAGSFDVFAVKLASAGTLGYAVRYGNSGYDTANGIAVDASGRATLVGSYSGTIDLNPGSAVANRTATGGTDVFVAQIDAGGAYRNGVDFGGSAADSAGDVRLDAGGAPVIVGQFNGTLDADPGAAVHSLTSAGGGDAYVIKLSASLDYAWSRRFGSSSADRATSVAIDGGGAVYVTGQFAGKVDFSGNGTAYRTSSGGTRDVFALKLTSGGAFANVRVATGSGSDDIGEGAAVGTGGRWYVVGAFSGSAKFETAADAIGLTSNGGSDLFVWQLV